jgi:WD40 repeat protein
VGEHGGVHFYVMQYIQGHGLDVILDDLRRLRVGAAGMPSLAAAAMKDDSGSLGVARSLLTGRFGGSRAEKNGESVATDRSANGQVADATMPEPGPRSETDGKGIGSVLSNQTESGYYRAVARLGVQVAQALAHAHGQGVLHRDIKPSNLLLDVDGHVWITDFGLAKVEGSDGPTRPREWIGTLRYMGPERFESLSDRRSDLYGLGMTLYELLTLRPAFDATTQWRLIDQVKHDPPIPPRKIDPRIPRDLETIVLKAIAKQPAERYATADAMAADLENFLADKPIAARRSGPAERAWLWCRRNPAAAGLLAACGVAAMALVGSAVAYLDHGRVQRAYQSEVQARRSEQVALKNEIEARKNEATIRYFNNMLLAEREWSDCNVGRAERLLDECIPKPASTEMRGWEWHYLKRQCHTDLRTIFGPESQAMGVAFSRDDRFLATTGYADKEVRIWNLESGSLEKSLRGLATRFMSEGLAYSPDGMLVAASCGDQFEPGTVIMWNAATAIPIRKFPNVCGAGSSVAFSPDSKRLAAVSGEWNNPPTLTIWDTGSGKKLVERKGKDGEMGWISVAFSPDGNSIATASGKLDQDSPDNQPGVVMIRESETGNLIGDPLLHPGPLTCVAFSPDPTRPMLATTGWDKILRVWDPRTRRVTNSIRVAPQLCFKVVFSPDGRRLAVACDDNSARVLDAANFEKVLTLRGHTREVHSVAFSKDGHRLATSSMDSTIKIWDPESGKEALTLSGHTGNWVQGAAFSPDGQRVAFGGIDGTLRVHDAANGQKLREEKRLTDPIECVAFSPDGSIIATGSGSWKTPGTQGQITLRNSVSGNVIRTLRAHAGMVLSVAFSPDGTRFATAGGEHHYEPGVVKIWDTKTCHEITSLEGHPKGRVKVVYSADGRFLASAGFDSLLIIHDAISGKAIHSVSAHKGFIMGLASNPATAQVASAGLDGIVKIWDIATGQEVSRFSGHKTIVWSVAFSPDGSRVASSGDDGTVKIWDPATGEEALTLRGHTDPVSFVAFSPDGNKIASASKDGTVKIWDGTPWVGAPTSTSTGVRTNRSP